jgi:hypothetical protein
LIQIFQDSDLHSHIDPFIVTTTPKICLPGHGYGRVMVYFYNAGDATVEISRKSFAYGQGIQIPATGAVTYSRYIGDDCENEFWAITSSSTASLRIEQAYAKELTGQG